MNLVLNNRKEPNEFKDPFQKNCVSVVHIHLYPDGHQATVETLNGDTKGEQKFRSKDIFDLFQRIENYVGHLK